jgi:hypothetical protein
MTSPLELSTGGQKERLFDAVIYCFHDSAKYQQVHWSPTRNTGLVIRRIRFICCWDLGHIWSASSADLQH